MADQRGYSEFAPNSEQFEGCERTNCSLEGFRSFAPSQELTERLAERVAETVRRKQARAEQRRQFGEARNIGLQRRHEEKLRRDRR